MSDQFIFLCVMVGSCVFAVAINMLLDSQVFIERDAKLTAWLWDKFADFLAAMFKTFEVLVDAVTEDRRSVR